MARSRALRTHSWHSFRPDSERKLTRFRHYLLWLKGLIHCSANERDLRERKLSWFIGVLLSASLVDGKKRVWIPLIAKGRFWEVDMQEKVEICLKLSMITEWQRWRWQQRWYDIFYVCKIRFLSSGYLHRESGQIRRLNLLVRTCCSFFLRNTYLRVCFFLSSRTQHWSVFPSSTMSESSLRDYSRRG